MSATLGKNPFRPGVGTKPLYLAGRDQSLRRFRSVIRAAPEQPANMRLTGLRGVGKTVLLGEFRAVAQELDWATAFLELQPGHNTDDAVSAAMAAALKATREEVSRVERLKSAVGGAARKVGTLGVEWGEFRMTYEPGASPAREDLSRALFETVESVVSHGKQGLMLLLDEVQVIRDETRGTGQHPLSLLVAAVSSLQKAELPIGMVLCGLPTLTGNLLRARSYTERMFRGEEIGSLGPDDAKDALVRPLADSPIVLDSGVAERVVEEVEGYPYFLQLWGAELWDAVDVTGVDRFSEQLLDAVRPEIYRRLDLDFYDPRIATLTAAEQDVLLASADCDYPPLVVADLNAVISKTPGNINVLLGRLVDSGVLYRIRKGQYEYTAPKFRDFLLRRGDNASQASLFGRSP
ncbi:MAG TPA: ATP-binding protein [Solirubrobacteraceae bacterium]|nr:ATP-binding protein [Solirubrobacteraceae bacterium]